jgi:heat shock protein HslJ
MKATIIFVILLISVISLAACINIYNPAPDTGSSTTPATPTTPASPASPATPTTPVTPATPATPAVQLAQFEDRTWVLEKYGKAGNLQDVIAGKEVNARFDSSSGKVNGTAGCNSYSAGYQRIVNKITVSSMTNTMMNCPMPAGIMQQEGAFKDALVGAESCRIIGGKLEINCTLNRLLLFEPK